MDWKIADKTVLVTGGTSGIGRATAMQMAGLGARVTITSRTRTGAATAVERIRAESGLEVKPAELDLSSFAGVRAFADEFTDQQDHLDVLVNNAGAMFAKREVTVDGMERTFGVNHLGPFLLTNLLAPLLEAGEPARVINVSSENHRSAKHGLDFDDLGMAKGYSASKAYGASKLANILFTLELNKRFAPQGVTARALHPGVVATNFGKGADGPRWMGVAMIVLKPLLASPDKGARTSVHLATAQQGELDGGLYWSSCQPKQPIPAALDEESASRLWDVSAGLVGV